MAKAGLHIMQQGKPLLHIAQSQTMPPRPLPRRNRIADFEHHHGTTALGRHANMGASRTRLHAVAHCVFYQRLQQERRQPGVIGSRV